MAHLTQAYDLTIKQTYTAEQLAIIQDKAHIDVTMPAPFPNPNAYVTATPQPIAIKANAPIFISYVSCR